MQSTNLVKRKLPKLMACMTKGSLENLRNKALFSLDMLDSKGIRRQKMPLHECLILELKESGYSESANYLQDLLYDNIQLLAEDEIGIVVDLRKRNDYLEHISAGLQTAEKERDKGNTKKECLQLLELALFYAEQGKGILWLAEKFFLASIAVSSQYMIDGGRQKGCCKYHYGKFLLDKFPGTDIDEPFEILTQVRDESIGKTWPLYETEEDNKSEVEDKESYETLFCATAVQLHRVLLEKARNIRKYDAAKAERLSRLAERRATDAEDANRTAEAIIEIGISQLQMKSHKNALKSFERAFTIQTENNNINGICEARMHLAAAMQRLGDHEGAAKMLTEMGALAMQHNLHRQLGRALHLLGELHLRRERPELGTQYLREAFACFMGFTWQQETTGKIDHEGDGDDEKSKLELIFKMKRVIYEQEAEQSRLLNAISAGQENMASFFNLLRESGACSVAQIKAIEWKLSLSSWRIKRYHHEFLPCLCPAHNRTPLDVIRIQQEIMRAKELETDSQTNAILERTETITDMRKLRSDNSKIT